MIQNFSRCFSLSMDERIIVQKLLYNFLYSKIMSNQYISQNLTQHFFEKSSYFSPFVTKCSISHPCKKQTTQLFTFLWPYKSICLIQIFHVIMFLQKQHFTHTLSKESLIAIKFHLTNCHSSGFMKRNRVCKWAKMLIEKWKWRLALLVMPHFHNSHFSPSHYIVGICKHGFITYVLFWCYIKQY